MLSRLIHEDLCWSVNPGKGFTSEYKEIASFPSVFICAQKCSDWVESLIWCVLTYFFPKV